MSTMPEAGGIEDRPQLLERRHAQPIGLVHDDQRRRFRDGFGLGLELPEDIKIARSERRHLRGRRPRFVRVRAPPAVIACSERIERCSGFFTDSTGRNARKELASALDAEGRCRRES